MCNADTVCGIVPLRYYGTSTLLRCRLATPEQSEGGDGRVRMGTDGYGWVRRSGTWHTEGYVLGKFRSTWLRVEHPKVRGPPVSHVQCDTVKCTEARERSYSRLHGSGTMPPQNTNSPRQMPDGCQCLVPLRLRRAGIARCRYCWQRNRTYRSYRTYKTGALGAGGFQNSGVHGALYALCSRPVYPVFIVFPVRLLSSRTFESPFDLPFCSACTLRIASCMLSASFLR